MKCSEADSKSPSFLITGKELPLSTCNKLLKIFTNAILSFKIKVRARIARCCHAALRTYVRNEIRIFDKFK